MDAVQVALDYWLTPVLPESLPMIACLSDDHWVDDATFVRAVRDLP